MKDYHNGPLEDDKRHCTDFFCCLILALFMIAMLVLGIYCWSSSNWNRLTTPYDAEGKGCGVDYPQYPFIYFVAPSYDSLWRTVCVKSCPKGTEKALDCKPNKYITNCNANPNPDSSIAINIYQTTQVRKTICLPTSQKLQKQISAALGQGSFEKRAIELTNVWPILLLTIPIAIILSIVFMCFIRLTAGCFVYILILLAIASCIGIGVYLIVSTTEALASVGINKVFAYILGGLLIAFGVLLTIGVCCYRKRIKLASVIVAASARFVKQNFMIIFLPFVMFLFLIAFLAVWLLQALGIYSLGQPTRQDKQWPFQHFNSTPFSKIMMIVHIFHLFWVVSFIIEACDFIVCGAVTSWYFKRNSPYYESVYRFRRYHIGSVALGSFFVALVGFIKFLYELLVPDQPQQNTCASNFKKFCDCLCCLCLNYLFKCFNAGAYTFIHLASDSYCTSAGQVIAVKIKNPVLTGVVTFMSALFSILIRVGITALTVVVGYILLNEVQPYKTQVKDFTTPCIFIGIIGFAIASLFVSLYSQAMQTIFVCYLLDAEAGGAKGVQDKAPQQFKQFLIQAKKQGHLVI